MYVRIHETMLIACVPLAVRDVLRLKGTAVDAALATVICAGVVHPFSMGLGGGFVMTVYKRDEQKAYTLVSREKAPGKATKDMFKGKKEASTTGTVSPCAHVPSPCGRVTLPVCIS